MLLSYITWSMSFIGETLRRGGRIWSDYWNQFIGNILSYTTTAKDPPNPIRYRTAKTYARKIILILGLVDLSSKSLSVPNIYLSVEGMMTMNMSTHLFRYI